MKPISGMCGRSRNQGLLEVLDALKAADVEDRIKQAATTICQALIEAELTAVIGAGPHEQEVATPVLLTA